jgi:hypothetical protein
MSYYNNIEANTINILLSIIIIVYENSICHIICGRNIIIYSIMYVGFK